MITGSITLTTKQLPAVADSVYLLAEDATPATAPSSTKRPSTAGRRSKRSPPDSSLN